MTENPETNEKGESRKEGEVAKDRVHLTHVEPHKQEVHPELQKQLERAQEGKLAHSPPTNDEITILSAIGKNRLFLSRIALIVNQARVPLGLPPFKKDQLEALLTSLEKKGYLIKQEVHTEGQDRDVFYLTERGLDEYF